MKVLLIGGLTGWTVGWIPLTTRHLVRAVADIGATPGYLGDVAMPAAPEPEFFLLDYPPADKAESQIRSAIAAFSPDLIHLTCGGIRLIRAVDRVAGSASQRSIPWIATAHNIPPAEKFFPRFFGYNRVHYLVRDMLALPSTLLWRKTLRRGTFSNLIVHSQTVRDRAVAAGCPAGKIKLISLGADLPHEKGDAAPAEQEASGASPFGAGDFPKLLCVAGMIHHKGQHDLVQATRILLKKYPKLKVVLLGASRSDDYAGYLKRLVHDLDLSNTVHFAHRAPDHVRAAAWADADLYVQPSHEEGFCFSFLEGIMAVPRAIGTRTGAMAEMAGNDPLVRIVSPADPPALAEATEALMALPVAPQQLAERRQRLLSQFSWDRYVAEHAELYRQAGK